MYCHSVTLSQSDMKARKLLMFLVFLTSLAGSPASIFRGAGKFSDISYT